MISLHLRLLFCSLICKASFWIPPWPAQYNSRTKCELALKSPTYCYESGVICFMDWKWKLFHSLYLEKKNVFSVNRCYVWLNVVSLVRICFFIAAYSSWHVYCAIPIEPNRIMAWNHRLTGRYWRPEGKESQNY